MQDPKKSIYLIVFIISAINLLWKVIYLIILASSDIVGMFLIYVFEKLRYLVFILRK